MTGSFLVYSEGTNFNYKTDMTVKLMLNTDRPSKTGKYPLVFRIIHLRKKKLIYTPYRLRKGEFDPASRSVVACCGSDIGTRERAEINRTLQRQTQEIERIAAFLQQTKPGYTRGVSLVDILFLKKTDIADAPIWYTRHKTKQRLRIAVNEAIGRLVRKYDEPGSHFVFPFIGRLPRRSLYARYRSVLGAVNYYLKQLGKRLDIDTPLTTYVARHSWATQAKELGAPVTVISEGLGHTSEKTTQIYLKEFDRNVVDSINDTLSDLYTGK